MSNTYSLRRKLLTWLLLPMLLLLLLSGVGTYYLSARFANAAFDHVLADSARDLALQVTVVNGVSTLNLPQAAVQMFLSDEYDKIYYKVTEDGRFIAGDPSLPLPDIVSGPSGPPVMQFSVIGGKRVRIASRYFLPVGTVSGEPVLVQVAETLNKRRILAGQIITAMVVPQFILVALAALTVWLGIGKGLSPLRNLRKDIASRSHRDLRPVEESNAPEEVRPIIYAINGLMHRLGDAFEAQQRFIANAAHQLRTPLSGLKTQTDLALRHTDPASLQHSLQQLSVSTDRTVHLVNQMLTLARIEPWAGKTFDMKPLDLNELAHEIAGEWVPRALQRNIDFGYDGADGQIINGNKVLLRMLIDNLLDNATRYTLKGGCITASVKPIDKSVLLTVEDNGPGIPREERKAVFQRFYRTADTSGDGSGLGLSIVEEVALAHNASVVLDEPAGHSGTVVKIIFPRCETP